MSTHTNVLTEEDIYYINTLPEVLEAKTKLTSSNDKYTFYITLTDSIRASLSTLGLDFSNVTQIPMRWISGNTLEHVDHGKSQFSNTYLVFMNNSPGSFVIDDVSYSITQNTAYVFNEGVRHKTLDTQGVRLLIGPMNEFAEPVGNSAVIYYFPTEYDALAFPTLGPSDDPHLLGATYGNLVLGRIDNASDPGFTGDPGVNNGWMIATTSIGISTGVHPNGYTLDNANYTSYYYVYPAPYNGVPCFAENTRVLTKDGYKQINKLTTDDVIITSDNKEKAFNLYITKIQSASVEDAPYIIEPHAFDVNKPSAPVYLSPKHKIYMNNDIWTSAELASKTNPLIKQYDIGKPVTYYHIECNDYFTDNIVAEDLVVESFGTLRSTHTTECVWYKTHNGYVRKNNNYLDVQKLVNYTHPTMCVI